MSAAQEVIPRSGVNYLRHHQRAELRHEKDQLEKQLNSPQVQDKGAVRGEIEKRNRQLAFGTPPELTDKQRDALAREEKTLRKTLVENMQSEEELRKAPSGAVGRLLSFEKRFKPSIMRWKNIRIALEPENPDPDLANLEVHRPHAKATDPSMHSAHIQGQEFSFPSEMFKQAYDQIDFTKHGGETAEARMEAELVELREAVKELRAAAGLTDDEPEPATEIVPVSDEEFDPGEVSLDDS